MRLISGKPQLPTTDPVSLLRNCPGANASLAVFAQAIVEKLLRRGPGFCARGNFFPSGYFSEVSVIKRAQREPFGLQGRHFQYFVFEGRGKKAAGAHAQRVQNRPANSKLHGNLCNRPAISDNVPSG